MPAEGSYELLLRRALEGMHPGPWSERHLPRVSETLTDEFCFAVDPSCDRHAVIDWLSALPSVDMTDLLDRLNAAQGA